MLIYLLRHGRTVTPGTYTGASDIVLSAEGEQQVLDNTSFLSTIGFDSCFCSPLLRCRKTLELLDITVHCKYDPDLREIDFGNWEGRTFSQIFREDKEIFEEWVKQKEQFTFPNGDNISAFTSRVATWFNRLLTSGEETVLIVTHAGVIRKAICHLLGLRQEHADRFKINEAGVTIVSHEDGFSTLCGLNIKG